MLFVDTDILHIDRPEGMPGNRLGLTELDLSTVSDQKIHDLILHGQQMERDRGVQGFSPNTVGTLYTPEGHIVLGALHKVVLNHEAWRDTSVTHYR